MHIHLLSRRDVVAGLFFCLFGAVTVAIAGHYPMGTVMRMGPGYFPFVLGCLLISLGSLTVLGAVRLGQDERDARIGAFALRPLALIAAGVLFFAYAIQSMGLALSTVGLVLLTGIAHREFRWLELGILGVVLSTFAVSVFAYGLRLPFPVLPI